MLLFVWTRRSIVLPSSLRVLQTRRGYLDRAKVTLKLIYNLSTEANKSDYLLGRNYNDSRIFYYWKVEGYFDTVGYQGFADASGSATNIEVIDS